MSKLTTAERLQVLADLAAININGGERPDGMGGNAYLRAVRYQKSFQSDEEVAQLRRTLDAAPELDEPVPRDRALVPQGSFDSPEDFLPSPIAMHEAAHAVVGHVLGRAIAKVAIEADGTSGYCRAEGFDAMVARGVSRRHAARVGAIYVLAGGAVQPDKCPPSTVDYELARNLIGEAGGDPAEFKWAERRAVDLVDRHREAIVRVALALDRRKVLSGSQVANLIDGRPLDAQRQPVD